MIKQTETEVQAGSPRWRSERKLRTFTCKSNPFGSRERARERKRTKTTKCREITYKWGRRSTFTFQRSLGIALRIVSSEKAVVSAAARMNVTIASRRVIRPVPLTARHIGTRHEAKRDRVINIRFRRRNSTGDVERRRVRGERQIARPTHITRNYARREAKHRSLGLIARQG